MVSRKKRSQGKRARAAGARFELKVRQDLEKKWIVSKWMNNVDLQEKKLVKIKHKFLGPGKPMMLGAGFPDFICFKRHGAEHYDIIGVEVKANGWLDKTEKEKSKWLLDNGIFSKILIAKKGKKRGEVEYIDFKERYE